LFASWLNCNSIAGPDGFVVGAAGDGDGRADHVQLVLYAGVHWLCVFDFGLGGKFVKSIYWRLFGFVRKSAVSGHGRAARGGCAAATGDFSNVCGHFLNVRGDCLAVIPDCLKVIPDCLKVNAGYLDVGDDF